MRYTPLIQLKNPVTRYVGKIGSKKPAFRVLGLKIDRKIRGAVGAHVIMYVEEDIE